VTAVGFITPAMHRADQRARSVSIARFDAAAQAAESRVAAGLVSVSTSVPPGVSVPAHFAANCITIDRPMQRVTNLRKQVGVGAKLLHNMAEGSERFCLVTLTYRGDNRDWRPHHISDYIRAVRKWFDRQHPGRRLRYVWVAELQQRGVIHYHAVFWLPKGLTMPKADKRGWWPHGMSNTKRATAPIAYLMSYVSKVETKTLGGFPHGARIYGLGGLDRSGAAIRRWVRWPAYVQGNAAAGEPWRPVPGGGYVNADDGRLLLSEFAPTGAGYSSFIRVRHTPRAIDAAGPFSWAPQPVTLH
jgi:hypothetical protein